MRMSLGDAAVTKGLCVAIALRELCGPTSTLAQKLRLHAKASQRQVSGLAAVIAHDRRAEKESERRQNHQSR
jgi:hypothetical protein